MKNNKVLRASIWYTISSFLLKGIGFITTPIFSRLLTQEEYGIVSNYNAWLAIAGVVCSLSLSASLVRARFDYKEELDTFIKSNLIFGSIITLGFMMLFILSQDFWTELFVLDTKYILLMLVVVLVNPAYDMFLQKSQFQYKYKIVAVLSTILALVNVCLSLILMYFMQDNLAARLIGSQLPTIIIGGIIYGYFVIKGKTVNMSYIKYAVPICIPYMVHLLSGTLLNSSDRIMITNFCGATDNALYSMAYNVALIASVLWSSMNTAYSPWLGENLNAKEYTKIKKYTYGYVLVFVFVVFGIMLITPEVLLVLGGDRYLPAKYVIPPVMVGYIYLFLYSLYVNVEQFAKKTLGMAVCTIFCALLNIGLNWFFIPRIGYIAAAYTTLFSYLIMLIVHYALVRAYCLQVCYDNRFIAFISIASFLIAIFVESIYDLTLIRYLILFSYTFASLIIMWKYKKTFIGVISKNEKNNKGHC